MKRLTLENFEKRNDKYSYHKLAQHQDPKGLIVSNHVSRDVGWIGDLFDEKSATIYSEYRKYHNSIAYSYESELKLAHRKIDGDINTLLLVNKQTPVPPLYTLYLKKLVRIETIVILDNYLSFIDMWNRFNTDTILWPRIYIGFQKYRPFITFNEEKLKQITKEICLNNRLVPEHTSD